VGLRQIPITFMNFRLAYRREGWNKFWNGLRMEYGTLWWQDALKENPDRDDAKRENIEAILPHLHPQIADMVTLQHSPACDLEN
jgi:hypothetical protein